MLLHQCLAMVYPSWQSSSERCRQYCRRRPEDSALYRLVYYYHDQLGYCWEEQFSQRYGVLRAEVVQAFERYLDCGILKHGCALACCENPDCNHSLLLAFSCKRRGLCPSCQAKRAVVFAEHLHENVLLAKPHRHLVFSIPKRLRVYFRYDRSLFSILYRAAWESWSEWVTAVIPGARAGAVMALHTAGSTLNWHPHIHGIFVDGGALPDGSFEQLSRVDTELLEEFFAEKLFTFLIDKQLLDEETVTSMKRWQHSGFSVYAGEPVAAEDKDARLFLARYLKKAPLSLERLLIDETGIEPRVRYVKHRDEAKGPGRKQEKAGEEVEREFSPLEFLAELTSHIPQVFEQTTRYFGVYSPRTRGAKAREERFQKLLLNNFEPLDEPISSRQPSPSWARCIKLVFEIDPLLCPKCGSEMKIKSFILNSREVERLCKHLNLQSWRAPPPLEARLLPEQQVWLDDSAEFTQIH